MEFNPSSPCPFSGGGSNTPETYTEPRTEPSVVEGTVTLRHFDNATSAKPEPKAAPIELPDGPVWVEAIPQPKTSRWDFDVLEAPQDSRWHSQYYRMEDDIDKDYKSFVGKLRNAAASYSKKRGVKLRVVALGKPGFPVAAVYRIA